MIRLKKHSKSPASNTVQAVYGKINNISSFYSLKTLTGVCIQRPEYLVRYSLMIYAHLFEQEILNITNPTSELSKKICLLF